MKFYDDTLQYNPTTKAWETLAATLPVIDQLQRQGLTEQTASPDWQTGTSRRQALMRALRYDQGYSVVIVDRVTPELKYALTHRANRRRQTLVIAPLVRYQLIVSTALQAQLDTLQETIAIEALSSDIEDEARQQYHEALEILALIGEELPPEPEINRTLELYALQYGVTVSHMSAYDYVPADRTGRVYRRSVTTPDYSARALAYALTRYHQQNSEPDSLEDPEHTTASPSLLDILYST